MFGRPDVDQFLDELEASQVDEWRAFLEVEPTGEDRADFRFAQLAIYLGSLLGDESKVIGDFMVDPLLKEMGTKPEQTAHEQWSSITSAFGVGL